MVDQDTASSCRLMRILTYVPLNPTQPRLHPLTAACIDNLSWSQSMPIVFGRNDTPNKRGKYADIVDKHNEARRMVLDGDYDALFLVEADMVIPPDALQRLVAVDAPVAYGLYVMRYMPYQWLAFTKLSGYEVQFVSAQPDLAAQWFGNVVETQGAGMGCTLIRREVLEQLAFRLDPLGVVADDWTFALDCIAYGVRQVHDCGLVCGHIDGGNVLWPDPDAKELVRREKL